MWLFRGQVGISLVEPILQPAELQVNPGELPLVGLKLLVVVVPLLVVAHPRPDGLQFPEYDFVLPEPLLLVFQ